MAERQFAYLAVFQCDRVATVRMRTNAVHPDKFARHKKTGYLIPPILAGDGGFEETGPDSKK